MTPTELRDELATYIGRQCRISSSASAVAWRANEWPTIVDVYINQLDEVWVRAYDGASWKVTENGLTVELMPAVGTYDFADGRDQMEAIGTVIRRWDDITKPTEPSPTADDVPKVDPRPVDDQGPKGGPNLDGF